MAGLRDQYHLAQARDETAHPLDRITTAESGQVHIALAGQEEGRDAPDYRVQAGRLLPPQVHAPIPVQTAGEPCPAELGRVVVQLRAGQPGPGQRRGRRQDVDIAAAAREMREDAEVGAGPGLLKVMQVQEVIARDRGESRTGPAPGTPGAGIVQDDDGPDPAGMAQRHFPGQLGTEIEPDEHGPVGPAGVDQAGDVTADLRRTVGGDVRRSGGPAISAQVRGECVVPGGDSRELVAPGVPQVREAMAQDDRDSVAGLGISGLTYR